MRREKNTVATFKIELRPISVFKYRLPSLKNEFNIQCRYGNNHISPKEHKKRKITKSISVKNPPKEHKNKELEELKKPQISFPIGIMGITDISLSRGIGLQPRRLKGREGEGRQVGFNVELGGYFSTKRNTMSIDGNTFVRQDQVVAYCKALLEVFRSFPPPPLVHHLPLRVAFLALPFSFAVEHCFARSISSSSSFFRLN
jgi:Nitrite and sulphite reductase 4Fe-4S domain